MIEIQIFLKSIRVVYMEDSSRIMSVCVRSLKMGRFLRAKV